MRTNAYQNYFENEILAADPVRLVQLLYRGAIDAIGSARRHLAAGEIRERSNALTKALNILAELIHSLDHERGGELSQNLLRVYDYTQRLLIDGNARQVDAPLAEAEKLLSTIAEAWQQSAPAEPVLRSKRATVGEHRYTPEYDPATYQPLSCAC